MRIAMPLVEQALEGRAPASTPAASS
jgi:hypothetical protein